MTPTYEYLARPDDLADLEEKATAAGRVLDHWRLYPERADLLAVRTVATVEERDTARAYRHLGLDVPRR